MTYAFRDSWNDCNNHMRTHEKRSKAAGGVTRRGWGGVGPGGAAAQHPGRQSRRGSNVSIQMNAGNEKLFTAVKPFKIIQTTENSINVIFLNIIIFVRGGHCKYSPLAPHPPQKKKLCHHKAV